MTAGSIDDRPFSRDWGRMTIDALIAIGFFVIGYSAGPLSAVDLNKMPAPVSVVYHFQTVLAGLGAAVAALLAYRSSIADRRHAEGLATRNQIEAWTTFCALAVPLLRKLNETASELTKIPPLGL